MPSQYQGFINGVNKQLKLIGHTKSSFCKSIGIGRMTFDRYLNGDNMNTKTVDKIEEALYAKT